MRKRSTRFGRRKSTTLRSSTTLTNFDLIEDNAEQARIAARMELYDNLELPAAELVQEFGLNRVWRIYRQYYGRWEELREILEAERLRDEHLRWTVYEGRLPVKQ